jgi:ribonuclease Z
VGNHLTIEAFATDHGLPSLGYHLLQSRYRLKHEYRDRPPDELAGLRRQGVEFEQEEIVVWLSYCGDTGPGVFDLEPRILQSSVLLLECTFFDEDSRERAREFGHMHLDDLVAHAADFRNDDLILHHLSRRYDCSDVVQRTSERFQLPHTRVHLFGC